MVVSFGCDTEETERRLLIFPKAGGFDGSRDHDGVAPRDVCSQTRERRVTALPVRKNGRSNRFGVRHYGAPRVGMVERRRGSY
jgi:hypothetical protein